MQTNEEFLAAYTPELERGFFKFIQTDAALRLLYNVNPSGAKIVYLKQCQAAKLESFHRFASRNELKPENVKTVKSIEDVHRAVDAIKMNIRGTCRSTQHLVLLAHRLLHSCKICQRFIRRALGHLRGEKAILLSTWKTVEENARKNLSAELSRRAAMFHASQAQDTIRDMWSLYLDCFASEPRMRDAIDCCWRERRDLFVGRLRAWRKEQEHTIYESDSKRSAWACSSRLRAVMLTYPHMRFRASQVTFVELCAHLQLLLIRSAASAISLVSEEGRAMVMQLPSFVGPLDEVPSYVSYYHALCTMEPRRNLTALMILKEYTFDVKLKLPPAGPSFTRDQYKRAGDIASKWHLVPVYRDGLRRAANGKPSVSAAAVREAVYKYGMSEEEAARKAMRDEARSVTNQFLDDKHTAREVLQLRRLSSPMAYRRGTHDDAMSPCDAAHTTDATKPRLHTIEAPPIPLSPRRSTRLDASEHVRVPAVRRPSYSNGRDVDVCGLRGWEEAYRRSRGVAGETPTTNAPQQDPPNQGHLARDVRTADSGAALRFAKMLKGMRPISATLSSPHPQKMLPARPHSAASSVGAKSRLLASPSPPPSSMTQRHSVVPIADFVSSFLDQWGQRSTEDDAATMGGGEAAIVDTCAAFVRPTKHRDSASELHPDVWGSLNISSRLGLSLSEIGQSQYDDGTCPSRPSSGIGALLGGSIRIAQSRPPSSSSAVLAGSPPPSHRVEAAFFPPSPPLTSARGNAPRKASKLR